MELMKQTGRCVDGESIKEMSRGVNEAAGGACGVNMEEMDERERGLVFRWCFCLHVLFMLEMQCVCVCVCWRTADGLSGS